MKKKKGNQKASVIEKKTRINLQRSMFVLTWCNFWISSIPWNICSEESFSLERSNWKKEEEEEEEGLLRCNPYLYRKQKEEMRKLKPSIRWSVSSNERSAVSIRDISAKHFGKRRVLSRMLLFIWPYVSWEEIWSCNDT